jgi:hypothetical protein
LDGSAFRSPRSGIFVAGACFSITEGVLELMSPGEHGDPTIAFIVLAVACAAVAARVAFADDISASDAENAEGEIDLRLQERISIVRHVFLDPTRREREAA